LINNLIYSKCWYITNLFLAFLGDTDPLNVQNKIWAFKSSCKFGNYSHRKKNGSKSTPYVHERASCTIFRI